MSVSSELKGRWFPLEDRAVFRLTGPDRIRFLNGQVTNDVSGPLDQGSVAACLCTIKGKVEALVWISADESSLILDGELSQREAIHARLERYLIADDCEITDETGAIRMIHHFVEGAPGIPSHRLSIPGRDLILKVGVSHDFDPNRKITEEELNDLRLIAAIPAAGCEITGDEFPAELGLDARAVSFHKGCYLGQEIISRIESVGRVKRRLRVIETELPLPAGSLVENIYGESGITTRNGTFFGEKCFLSIGLFKTGGMINQPAENEVVKATEKHLPTDQ